MKKLVRNIFQRSFAPSIWKICITSCINFFLRIPLSYLNRVGTRVLFRVQTPCYIIRWVVLFPFFHKLMPTHVSSNYTSTNGNLPNNGFILPQHLVLDLTTKTVQTLRVYFWWRFERETGYLSIPGRTTLYSYLYIIKKRSSSVYKYLDWKSTNEELSFDRFDIQITLYVK